MSRFEHLAQPGIQVLSPYQPGKPVEELERELGISNIVKLASNENPHGPSPAVTAALPAMFAELARYPDGSAYRLKQGLAGHLGVTVDQLTVGNGSNDVLNLLARVFLSSANEVLVSQHSFVVYPLAATAIGATLKVIPAVDYRQDLAATLAAVTDKTRMVFIANPNNPTGTWVDEDSLRTFLDALPAEIIVVLDEAYFEYVEADGYPDGLTLLEHYPNLVVTRTFSKAYGLAALRVGYAISHPEIADLLNRLREPFNVNALALEAATIALSDQQHVAQSVADNTKGMAYLVSECEQRGWRFIPSVGNFLTIDVGDAARVYEQLLQAGVIVRPVAGYEMPHHLRVTIGLQEENERFVSALAQVLANS